MNYLEKFRSSFKSGTMTMRLIYVNVALFLLMAFLRIILRLFNVDLVSVTYWFSVPANLNQLLSHIWTPITYMFYHERFFHILFNMLMLYWFGNIFVMYFSEKKLLSLYLFGGLMGALFYIVAYNVFPYYQSLSTSVAVSNIGNLHYYTVLMGASGSIMAIILAIAVKAPDMELNLLFLGRVKLKWIAIAMILISFFGITSENGGGEMAHLGGALGGYLFALSSRKGRDITAFIGSVIDFFINIFKPKPKEKRKVYHPQKMSKGDFNQQKAKKEEDIDRILDKIKSSGYESLTTNEKKRLFEQKK